MKQIIAFCKKNRLLIIGALVIIAILQWCQYQANTQYRQAKSQPHQQETVRNIESQEMPIPDEAPQSNPWLPYFILVGMTFVVYIAQKRGWIEKLVPGMMILRMRLFKQNERQMMRIFLLNTSNHSHDIDSPVVEFIKPGVVKAYRIKINDNEIGFPLTMTQRTSHMMVIDLDRFYDRIPELKSFHWVKIKVIINSKSIKRTFPKPVWSSFYRNK